MKRSILVFLVLSLTTITHAQANIMDNIIKKYLIKKNNKALAQSIYNGWTWQAYNFSTLNAAKKNALKNCKKKGRSCVIIYLNNKRVRPVKRKFSLPNTITVFDKVTNKKQLFHGKTIIYNIYAKTTKMKIITNSGKIVCSDIQAIMRFTLKKIRGSCLGQKKGYIGTYRRSAKYYIGKYSYKGSTVEIKTRRDF